MTLPNVRHLFSPPLMEIFTMSRTSYALRCLRLLPLLPTFALAHEGHGIEGVSHYHATDAWGFLAALAVVAAMWWMSRGK